MRGTRKCSLRLPLEDTWTWCSTAGLTGVLGTNTLASWPQRGGTSRYENLIISRNFIVQLCCWSPSLWLRVAKGCFSSVVYVLKGTMLLLLSVRVWLWNNVLVLVHARLFLFFVHVRPREKKTDGMPTTALSADSHECRSRCWCPLGPPWPHQDVSCVVHRAKWPPHPTTPANVCRFVCPLGLGLGGRFA